MQERFFLVSVFDKLAINMTLCFEIEEETDRGDTGRKTPQERLTRPWLL